MKDYSSYMHGFYSVIFQTIIGAITSNWWAGGLAAVMFYLGREHAQVQYKIAKGFSIKKLDPWEGLDIVNWSDDHKKDLIVPIVACIIYGIVANAMF